MRTRAVAPPSHHFLASLGALSSIEDAVADGMLHHPRSAAMYEDTGRASDTARRRPPGSYY